MSKPLPHLTFQAGWRHPVERGACGLHFHQHIEIVCHAGGAGRCHVENGPWTDFAAGSLMVFPPQIAHDQFNTESGEDLCLHIADTEGLFVRFTDILHIPQPAQSSARLGMQSLCRPAIAPTEFTRTANDYRAAAVVYDILGELAAIETRQSLSTADWLADRAAQYLREHYQTLKEVREVARHLQISEHYLRHIFKARHRIGLRRKLIKIRIERACDLLIHSSLSQKAVAHLCGFDNERYFSTSFRAEMGCTPKEFRGRPEFRV